MRTLEARCHRPPCALTARIRGAGGHGAEGTDAGRHQGVRGGQQQGHPQGPALFSNSPSFSSTPGLRETKTPKKPNNFGKIKQPQSFIKIFNPKKFQLHPGFFFNFLSLVTPPGGGWVSLPPGPLSFGRRPGGKIDHLFRLIFLTPIFCAPWDFPPGGAPDPPLDGSPPPRTPPVLKKKPDSILSLNCVPLLRLPAFFHAPPPQTFTALSLCCFDHLFQSTTTHSIYIPLPPPKVSLFCPRTNTKL